MKVMTQRWIEKAEKDFKICAREMQSSEPVYDAICFHSQQCVEKYLKAILQENEIYFEKTHDLGSLAYKCRQFINISDEMIDNFEKLSEYAVEVRYPGIDATKEEAEEAFVICQSLRNLVRKYFGLEVVG